MIKEEPPFLMNNSDDLNNNSNSVNQEASLTNMISDDLNFTNFQTDSRNGGSSSVIQQDIKPSVINIANSRLLNMENNAGGPGQNLHIKQEAFADTTNRLVQNHASCTNIPGSALGVLSDIDLDDIPDNIIDDMDISGFNLNDQDFTSIKSIVEQTFKDGRDVLDIISAV